MRPTASRWMDGSRSTPKCEKPLPRSCGSARGASGWWARSVTLGPPRGGPVAQRIIRRGDDLAVAGQMRGELNATRAAVLESVAMDDAGGRIWPQNSLLDTSPTWPRVPASAAGDGNRRRSNRRIVSRRSRRLCSTVASSDGGLSSEPARAEHESSGVCPVDSSQLTMQSDFLQ